MKRVIVFAAMLLLLSTTSACVPKASAGPTQPEGTPVAFRLMVWDEEGLEVTTETDDGGWAADITITGIATVPGNVVLIADPITGAEQPSPYSYVGFIPHLSWQLFGPDVASVSFSADFLLLPGWSMQCYTLVNSLITHTSGRIYNATILPAETNVTCIFP